MLLPTLLLAGWFLPAPAFAPRVAAVQQRPHAATHAPAGPKTEAALQADLQQALEQPPLAGDRITITISGDSIQLSGEVHAAEDKGVATRVARAVAEKDGWAKTHVLNELTVKLAHQ